MKLCNCGTFLYKSQLHTTVKRDLVKHPQDENTQTQKKTHSDVLEVAMKNKHNTFIDINVNEQTLDG